MLVPREIIEIKNMTHAETVAKKNEEISIENQVAIHCSGFHAVPCSRFKVLAVKSTESSVYKNQHDWCTVLSEKIGNTIGCLTFNSRQSFIHRHYSLRLALLVCYKPICNL